MARENFWAWLSGGLGVALFAAALALWVLYGPLVFIDALTSVWTCL
ncbi:hypothetical protein [uncultured Rhodoblastus sp.]|nr:hypothetical protein [uncultured Rhodoblastus sp.]